MKRSTPTASLVKLLRDKVAQGEPGPLEVPKITIRSDTALVIAYRMELGESTAQMLQMMRDLLRTIVDKGAGPEYAQLMQQYLDELKHHDSLRAAAMGLEG